MTMSVIVAAVIITEIHVRIVMMASSCSCMGYHLFLEAMYASVMHIMASAMSHDTSSLVNTIGYSRAMYVHHTIVMQTVTTMSSVASSQFMTFLRGYRVAGY